MKQSNVKITVREVYNDPIHIIAFGFGAGLVKLAPGTAGSLVGMILSFLTIFLSFYMQLFVALILVFFGIWICGKSADKIGIKDFSGIVLDEIIGIYWVLILVPLEWNFWFISFFLFRIFDIWKPWPIRSLETIFTGGFGIVIDDLMAAFFTVLMIYLIDFLQLI